MKLNPGLLALAVGAFGIGVTEFAPMGLLPVIADDLGVSIPVAGLLISAYAIGVMLGAPLMTLTTGRVPRRTLLIALAAILAAFVTQGLMPRSPAVEMIIHALAVLGILIAAYALQFRVIPVCDLAKPNNQDAVRL